MVIDVFVYLSSSDQLFCKRQIYLVIFCSELITHREFGGIFVIVTGRICMCKHLFGHETVLLERDGRDVSDI